MKNKRKFEKGSVLILSFMTFAVLFTIGQGFFARSLNEAKLSEISLSERQAFYLAEGGKNAALADLRVRATATLNNGVRGVSDIARLQSYLPISRSLEFLRDYAGFTLDNPGISGNVYVIPPGRDIGTGNYSSLIEVFTNGAPSNGVPPNPERFVFPYRYQISATGSSTIRGTVQQFVQSTGVFTVTVERANFARYALFTNTHTSPSGGVVWFTDRTNFTGPVHTNGRFSFANNPSGSFTNGATQSEQTARFYNNGSALLLDADRNGTRDVPVFQGGFSRGVSQIALPSTTDRQNQQRAALGLGSSESIPALSNGIYLPQNNGAVIGGIYVQGDAQVTLARDAQGHQRYAIQQGSTTQEITVNPSTNTTTVTTGSTTTTYTGTPRGIVYVEGNVSNLSGTVSNETQLTIASRNDLQITNHVRYENYRTTPTLNANGERNLLGLLSWEGNVRITTAAPDDLDIHGTVMAPAGIFTVDNYSRGSSRGTVNLLGGAITYNYGAFGTFRGVQPISGYGRNFVYDTRMRQGQSPPYFPTITLFVADNTGVNNRPTWDRRRRDVSP